MEVSDEDLNMELEPQKFKKNQTDFQTHHAVVLADSKGIIIAANQETYKMFEYGE